MYNYKTVREHIEQYLQNSFSTQLYLRKNLANVLICKQLYWVIHNRGKIDIFDSISVYNLHCFLSIRIYCRPNMFAFS